MQMQHITSAEMLEGLRLLLRFEDGFEGVAALAETVHKGGALAVINENPQGFLVGPGGRAVVWIDSAGDEVDLCADALRMLAEQTATRAAE